MGWLDLFRQNRSQTGRAAASSSIGDQPPGPHIIEQFNPAFFAGAPLQEDRYWGRVPGGSEEDYYWRRLSNNLFQKDVLPATYLDIHNQCYEAYNANPLAFSIIELTTSFVLGEGLTVTATQLAVQEVIDAFWQHQDNHMDERVYSLCTELSLYGELFIRFFVNRYDGSVIIRQVDPSLIDAIETDPQDIEKPLRYHCRPVDQAVNTIPDNSQARSLDTSPRANMEGE